MKQKGRIHWRSDGLGGGYNIGILESEMIEVFIVRVDGGYYNKRGVMENPRKGQ